MRDVNNLLNNLTYSEKYTLIWLLDQLIKSKVYKVSFTVREMAEKVATCEVTVRSTIRKLAIAEVINWKQVSKKKVHICVTSRSTFHKLVKRLEVR